MAFHVRTQAFSGPFDLLLTLVSRQKVAIGSIAVAEVADQYLAEVRRMGEMDLDVASDFVLVASTLLDIKAASLVPAETRRPTIDDTDEDDLSDLTPEQARDLLVERLVAYKQFRNAGAALGSRMEATALMRPRTAGPGPDFCDLMPDYLEGVPLRMLSVIAADLFARREQFLLDAEHVAPRREPIALTVATVNRITRERGAVTFSELVGDTWTAEVVVATFLALLELFKRGSVTLTQSETFGEIDVVRIEGAAAFDLATDALASIEEVSFDA